MELIYKAAAAALTAMFIGLILKRWNPELATALNLCTICLILMISMEFIAKLRDVVRTAKLLTDTSELYFSAVLKCLAISLVSKFSADLCKDAGQSALASTVEFAGTVCALCVMMPLLQSALQLIGEFV